MKVLAIIQARMGSSRLPGKVLLDLGGRTMLARVVRRAGRTRLIDEVLVATTVAPGDDPIVQECDRLSVPCFRGDEDDVLDRYHRAAETHGADVVVRITSDCPLIDPDVTDQVVRVFLDQDPDYASNTLERTYPRGLDTEVVAAAGLARASREANEPYQRTHVMPYFYQNPERFQLLSVTGPQDTSGYRWTVDSPEDLHFVRAVYRRMGSSDNWRWGDVCHLLAREPGLVELNRDVRQKELVEG